MPLVKTYYPTKVAVIGIWHITETLAELETSITLSAEDKEAYKNFTVEKRKKEWLCTRILLQVLTNENLEIFYNENRKPYLKKSNLNISISHSTNYAVVFLDQKTNIGVDIEEPRKQVLNITGKFLSQIELAYLSEEDTIVKSTVMWCIKEVLYKYYSKKLLDFKTELAIEPFELKPNGMVWALIIKENYKKLLSVKYVSEPDFILAFVAGD